MRRMVVFVLCACALGGGMSGCGGQSQSDVTVYDAWVREVPPLQDNSAAYMVIQNSGSVDLALVSAETDVARVVELHKMGYEGDMMKMERVDSFPIRAMGRLELAPQRPHLMLIDLQRELKAGDTVEITLRFADSSTHTVMATVQKDEEEEEMEEALEGEN